jgi:hypothetical protein
LRAVVFRFAGLRAVVLRALVLRAVVFRFTVLRAPVVAVPFGVFRFVATFPPPRRRCGGGLS